MRRSRSRRRPVRSLMMPSVLDKAVESSGSYVSESEEVLPVKPVSARDMVEEHPNRTVRNPHAMGTFLG